MGSNHSHLHSHSHSHSNADLPGRGIGKKALARALFFVILFMIVEFVGGWWANSLALMTDAAHMASDSASLALALMAFWISDRPATPRMTFGYQRVEILTALLSGLGLWFLSGILVYEAILRFQNPAMVNGPLVLGIATVGLIVNIVTLKMLHHSHTESLNVKAAYLHVLGDLLGSVAAIIAGAVIWLSGWNLIDPILTCFIAVLVAWSSWGLIREAGAILLESAPPGIDPLEVQRQLSQLSEVEGVHDLHIWSGTAGYPLLSVHLVSPDADGCLKSSKALLLEKFKIQHTTIQVEHPELFNSTTCFDCEDGR